MKVEVLYVPGCANYEAAVQRVRKVLAAQGIQADLCEIAVNSEEQARQLEFPGSPTIRIDGEDIEPSNNVSLACRLYSNLSGIPSEDSLRLVLARTRKRPT